MARRLTNYEQETILNFNVRGILKCYPGGDTLGGDYKF